MYYGKGVFLCESKSGFLVSGECTVDSLHQIEMSKISTESGSSYKKKGKNRYPPHLYRLTPDVGALRNSSISGFFETDPI